MSPEQALGEEVDARADLYAVAVMLFQLLTGRLPFESMSAAAVLVMHVSSPPPTLAEFAPQLADSPLQALLDRGLAKRREDRYADAAEFLAALEESVGGVAASGGSGGVAGATPPRRTAPVKPTPMGVVPTRRLAVVTPKGGGRWVHVSALLVAVLVGGYVLSWFGAL